MDNKLVSIVIPCYRQSHFLPRAIQSCLEQTYPNVEIIVVDDGSPDNVRSILEPYFPRVRLICQSNQGLSAARNAGLREANGAFIKFLDSDDWLLPDCIHHQYHALANLSKHVCVIGYSRLYDSALHKTQENVYPEFGKMSHQLCYINPGPPHTYLFHTESVRRIRGFDTSLRVQGGHEDYDLLCRLAVLGYEFVVIHSIGVAYRQHAKSMSTNTDEMQISRSRVWQYFARSLLKQRISDVEQFIHLLGGYAQRLGNADFRYEAMDVLEEIYNQLIFRQHLISHIAATKLCLNIALIRKNLCAPKLKEEKKYYYRTIDILDRLSYSCIDQFAMGSILTISKGMALLQLTKSHLWIDRSHNVRKIFMKLQEIQVPSILLKYLLKMLEISSCFFSMLKRIGR